MSATYLKSDQQSIQNRLLPSNQTHNVFVPSGAAMVQAVRGKKRKMPLDAAATSQSGTPTPSVGNEDEEEEEEVSNCWESSVVKRAAEVETGPFSIERVKDDPRAEPTLS